MRVAVLLIALIGVIAIAVVVAARSSPKSGNEKGDGADVVPYLVLALAMGVAGFALAELAATAFPGDRFVFDPAESLATSLSALVVSVPFVIYFWRRQAIRRRAHPGSAGWALYLAVMELVFTTAFVVTATTTINGLFTDEPATNWPRAVVLGAIAVFHELAARATPPASDAGELQRVIGSGIGLIVATAGVTGVLAGLLATAYEAISNAHPLDPGLHPWLAMLIVGLPIWWYRWVRPWGGPPGAPRLTWSVIVAVSSLATAIGAGTSVLVQVVEYVATDTFAAGQHFEPVPVTLALALVGIPVWWAHRRVLDEGGDNPGLAYRYALAAIGLGTSVSMAIALTIAALDRSLIVGASTRDILTLAVVLVVGLTVWLVFERRADTTAGGRRAWPRSLYTLGVGIVFGLVAAGALITTLFILLRRLLGGAATDSLLQSTTVLVYSGLAAWYLLGSYLRLRRGAPEVTKVSPFSVTVVCAHPGMIATRFPGEARLRVLYRDDGIGIIDDQMADQIVEAVSNRASFVWVDDDGFRVAPMRDPG